MLHNTRLTRIFAVHSTHLLLSLYETSHQVSSDNKHLLLLLLLLFLSLLILL